MSEQLLASTTIEKEQPICRLELSFIDLPGEEGRKNTTRKECFLELFKNHLCYKIVGSYEYKDSEGAGIWKEKKANYRWTRPRKNLSDVDMYFDNIFSTWVIAIDFTGISEGNSWQYEDPKECLKVYEILKDYLITTKF